MRSFNIFRKGGSTISGILNMLGMAVAFATFYIILVQVSYDLNFNKGINESDKVFVIASEDMEGSSRKNLYYCRPLAEMILESSPNIECGGIIRIANLKGMRFQRDRNGSEESLFMNVADISGKATDVIGLKAVEGSLNEITDRNTLGISKSISDRFDLKAGSVLYHNDEILTIAAIYEDLPQNSHFKGFDVIRNIADEKIDSFAEWGYTYFIKVHDPEMISEMERIGQDLVRKCYMEKYFGNMPPPEELGMSQEEFDETVAKLISSAAFSLIPLRDLYFNDEINTNIERGNKKTTFILFLVALMIIGIAVINYINFFFAQIPERIKAVNTKKVLGSTRSELIIDIVKESLTQIIFILSLAFISVLLFNTSQAADLITADAGFAANPELCTITVIIAVIVSVLSSLYPAFYITSFMPAMVLKGSFSGTKTGQFIRYTLIGVQFVISICLTICSCFIGLQWRYMINHDMGFDKEQLLYIHLGNDIGSRSEDVEERLRQNHQIKDVTWANGDLLSAERMGWGRDWKGQMVMFQCYPVAYDFPQFMGITISEGRSFIKADEHNSHGTFIFNKAAQEKYGFTLEDRIEGHTGEPSEIVGFCENFSFMTLKKDVQPFALYLFGKDPWYHPGTCFIRVNANADYKEVMRHIREVLSGLETDVSLEEWNIHFFDENINAQYKKEEDLSLLISLFTLVAMIISLMGVFGLVMFETKYRRREIALRRVNGATINEILAMFCSKFVKIVLICYAVAAPLSWIITDRYLATFANRCPMYWWVFALALVAVLAVTIGVVVIRSWKAATADPANALKTE